MEKQVHDRTILVVDDDRGLVRLIQKALQREGFTAAAATSAEEAVLWLKSHRADLLLLDLKLQDAEGTELIERLEAIQNAIPFIIITGQGDERVAVEMMKRGARDYLVKDVRFLEFVPEVVRNVLEQLETEKRLAAAEEQVNLVQRVVEQGFSAVLIASSDFPDPQVLYINPSFANLTGYLPEQVVGKPLSALTGLAAVLERLRQGFPPEHSFVEDISSYTSGSAEGWVEWRIGPVMDRFGKVTHWLVILRDITERKRLEKEILEINDRVQRRIGQDLHDGLCQQLVGVELMCQVLEQKLAAKTKSEAARLGEIGGHVRDAISQARLMARGLSPIVLESEGLMSGLKELASNTEKLYGISCSFVCETPVLVNDHAMATHLFRIAQEAVSNAIRHGGATQLAIRLHHRNERLVLEIVDNGRGFDPDARESGGMGLRIMQSRASTIGGKLTIQPASSENGVRVTCAVALTDEVKQHGGERGGKKQNPKVQEEDPHRG